VGDTAANCWVGMYYLERACTMQVKALSAGAEGVLIAPDASQAEVRNQVGRGIGGALAWPGCLRKLERELPGYDA
jgi:ribulose-5-phosphate 4-epimerase/fuculose-1-phosphate aldolase